MLPFVIFLIVVSLTAGVGAIFSPGPWYAQLDKPDWTPPAWLFAPVWSTLYLAIAVAGGLVWRRSGSRVTLPLILWIVQLILNGAWSWLFFGLRSPALAFADIVLLLLFILLFMVCAFRVSRLAAYLFVPYALWVAFAAVLNFAIWQMNSA
jgi:tryptophan-rich sensory protein